MDATIGLLGVLIGAVVTGAVAIGLDRARAQREDRHRFTADRREVYARFLVNSDAIQVGLDALHDDGEPEVGGALAQDGYRIAYAELHLLGPERVTEAAGLVAKSIKLMADVHDALAAGREPPDTWEAARDAYLSCRSVFVAVASEAIGSGPSSRAHRS